MVPDGQPIYPEIAEHGNAIEEDFHVPTGGQLRELKAFAIPTLSTHCESGVRPSFRGSIERPHPAGHCVSGNILNTPVVRKVDIAPAAVTIVCSFKPFPGSTKKAPVQIKGLISP
jgi:hypothetical protein